MYRLYGDDLTALRLYGLGHQALGALGASSTSDYVHRYMQSWYGGADYLTVMGALQAAEAALGRPLPGWKYDFVMWTVFGTKKLNNLHKEAKAYLENLAAQPDEPEPQPGLGVVAAAITIGATVYKSAVSLRAGRKARQKARSAARGAKKSQQAVQIIVYRYARLLQELARLGIEPPDAPTSSEWKAAMERRLSMAGKQSTGNKAVWTGNLMSALETARAGLAALPTPRLPEAAAPSVTIQPAAPVAQPASPSLSPVTPAATAAVPTAAEGAAAAPAEGGGVAKLGLALLVARLLLGA